tara:strand:+ start:103 stop:291 length:189 start_codon:yes stop_codon:yes gene_type:complete
MARDQITPLMRASQFTLRRQSGKHLIWQHASGLLITTSKTASDHRALQNIRGDIRRALAKAA